MDPKVIGMSQANAEFLANLVVRNARFVIVGGTAVKFYLPEREVDDLDVLIDPVLANAELVIEAINAGGVLNYQFEPSALTKPKVQWPIKNYYYLDVLTPDAATDFECVWQLSSLAEVAHQPTPIRARIAGVASLIEMLGSSKEEKHRQDIESLSKLGDVSKQKA